MPSAFQTIVLAAGKGVRMRSALPKVLHPLCGKSLVARVLSAIEPHKPSKVIVVVGYGKELVEAELARCRIPSPGTEIGSVIQAEQLGTGDAVRSALPALGSSTEKVLVVPGDMPLVDESVFQRILQSKADLAFLTVDAEDPTGFGRVVRSTDGNVQAIVEEKDCTPAQKKIREINCSVYFVSRSLLEEALRSLQPNNAQGEYYLTDIVAYAVQREKAGISVEGMKTEDFTKVAGANSRSELSALERHRRQEITTRLMDAGVTFEDPSNVYIDENVTIGADSFIGAGTRLRAGTVVEGNVIIEGDTLISNSRIGSGTKVKLGCYIEDSKIGKECQVGPFAHLRPGSELGDKAKVGNFVETKQATLGQGAKVSHLTYIGDASIGAEANIGAGTITCNYDGVRKHRTTIGASAFIGSNTSLVAPVSVGDNAVIGAGSVITKNVPTGALGIERSEQRTIHEYAKKRSRNKS